MCKGPEVESTNAFIEQINVLAVQTYPSLYPSFFPRTLEGTAPSANTAKYSHLSQTNGNSIPDKVTDRGPQDSSKEPYFLHL